MAARTGVRWADYAPRLIGGLLVLGAVAFGLMFLATAALRVVYPYPLEPTEPAALNEVERIRAGLPLYVQPTLEFVPLVYGPIYFYVAAAAASIMGDTYAPLRAVSLLASIGSIALVYLFVKRETDNRVSALAAAGLLAACNPLVETAMDLGRVDALFTFLILAGAYLVRRGGTRSIAAGGVLFGLAAVTKSPLAAVPVSIAALIYLAVAARRQVPVFAATLAAPLALTFGAATVQSGPWVGWYLWTLPRQHAVSRELIGRFWFTDVLPRLTLPLVIGPVFLIASVQRGERARALFYTLFAGAMLATGWASRANGGGAENVLLPGVAALAILFGLGTDEVSRQFSPPSHASGLGTYVLALGIVQLALLAYSPRAIVPLGSDARADDRLAEAMAALPGPIFAPDFAGYLPPAERAEQPLFSAVDELQGGYGGSMTDEGRRWNADLQQALAQHRFKSIVLERKDCCHEERIQAAGYVYKGSPFADNDDFYSWRTPRTPDPKVYLPPP